MFFDVFHRIKILFKPYSATVVHISLLVLIFGFGAITDIAAQQPEIAILYPSTASGIAEGDVNYARTVSKRFVRMLNSFGFSADEFEEATAAKVSRLQDTSSTPYRLIILPLNAKIRPETATILKSFVARGGKLFVTYNLADEVAQLLNLRMKKWLKAEFAGQFASVQFDAPDVLGIPKSIRQTSWNITVAEPTNSANRSYWTLVQ